MVLVSTTLLVNAIASVIGGQLGFGDGEAVAETGAAASSRWLPVGVAAFATLNCRRAPAIPPNVMPAIVAETLVIFIVDRTTRGRRERVRTQSML